MNLDLIKLEELNLDDDTAIKEIARLINNQLDNSRINVQLEGLENSIGVQKDVTKWKNKFEKFFKTKREYHNSMSKKIIGIQKTITEPLVSLEAQLKEDIELERKRILKEERLKIELERKRILKEERLKILPSRQAVLKQEGIHIEDELLLTFTELEFTEAIESIKNELAIEEQKKQEQERLIKEAEERARKEAENKAEREKQELEKKQQLEIERLKLEQKQKEEAEEIAYKEAELKAAREAHELKAKQAQELQNKRVQEFLTKNGYIEGDSRFKVAQGNGKVALWRLIGVLDLEEIN